MYYFERIFNDYLDLRFNEQCTLPNDFQIPSSNFESKFGRKIQTGKLSYYVTYYLIHWFPDLVSIQIAFLTCGRRDRALQQLCTRKILKMASSKQSMRAFMIITSVQCVFLENKSVLMECVDVLVVFATLVIGFIKMRFSLHSSSKGRSIAGVIYPGLVQQFEGMKVLAKTARNGFCFSTAAGSNVLTQFNFKHSL